MNIASWDRIFFGCHTTAELKNQVVQDRFPGKAEQTGVSALNIWAEVAEKI